MDNLIQTPAVVAPTPAPTPAAKKANGAAPRKAGKKATPAPAPVPAKRSSRVEPIQGKLIPALQKATDKNGLSVAAMAKSFGATEREVRLAIDRARNMGFKGELVRTVKGFFALTPNGKKIAAKLAAK